MKKTIHIPHTLHQELKIASAKSEVSIETFASDAILNRIRDLNDAPSKIEQDAPYKVAPEPTKQFDTSVGATYKPTNELR